ncbi:ATP-binding cassette domain-containing protein [Companilactobacillus ginsenosidimutans]|uniref:ABC transporter domain-containing protein n=1 Tax=Companilactobacillus ginsenosidimutans TaxID=1007676 RepID=A0A0H4QJS5_9LACO|nr:ABC transporter ATP-binding protein [Companilactobacillus ginsenosidimutans]AKP67296.1 hypothetical protein ABM34_06915 [Companilactobacillus ginsenosidimutans]
MLVVKGLNIGHEIRLINDFNFSFKEGNIYGFVAPNGSGKTTFFRSILDLIPSQGGDVTLNNIQIKNSKNDIFYFESSNWFDKNLSGLEYLKFIKKMYNSEKSIEKLITYFSMESFIKKPIGKYSLGMKQKVLFSMYVMSDATLLIMDEITNGLDEESRALLFQQLLNLKQSGKIIIISSHYLEDVHDYSDYIMKINHEGIEVNKNDIL